jgi:putative peptidoglycan lipid II flippase
MSTEKRKLIKSTGVVSFATSLSRMLGFVRDVIIARLFGTGIFAQAFVVAFRIPNMLRDLVGEGATNAAVVPLLTEYRTVREEEDYWELVRVLLNISFLVLTAIALLGIFVAPVVVRLIAPGFIKEPERLSITITLTRMLFPYVILIGLAAYGMGVLNSLKHFAAPAFGSVLLNISMIAAGLLLCPRIGVQGLAYGVLAGGALQLCLQIPVLYRKGLRLKRQFRLLHPGVTRIGMLLVPRMLGTAVYQLNVFIDTILASLFWIVGSGGVAALYYSNRLLQLPVAIFGLALAQVALPTMSSQAANNDIGKLKETISFSLRTVFFILIPASIGLMVLGKPIVAVLFERGAFDAYSTRITNHALFFYCFGLFAYAGIKILVNSFYSLQDTLTPVKTAGCALLVNTLLNLILMWPLKIGGLALATSIAGIFNFFLLFFILQKRIGRLDWRPILSSSSRVLIAALVMGCTGALLATKCPYFDFVQGSVFTRLVRLVVLIGINIGVFVAGALLLRVKEAKGLFAWRSSGR